MPRFAPQTRLTSTKGKADKLVVEPGASAHGGDCVGQRHTSTGGGVAAKHAPHSGRR